VSNKKPNRKRLAILGAGPEQVIAIQLAKELGFETVAVDDNPDAPGRSFADKFITTQIKNIPGLINALAPLKISGVMTHAAELAIETAHVAESLGLPGIGIEAAELGTIKDKRILHLHKNGIPVPPFEILNNSDHYSHWEKISKKIGYPLVAKPNNNKGAYGVMLIQNDKELKSYFEIQKHHIKADKFLCEKFLDGVQYSTESIVSNGKYLRHSLALRHYDNMEKYHPFLIEDGHSMPVSATHKIKSKMIELIQETGKVMGMNNGVIKGDLLVDNNQNIHVIEMATRSSGGRFADYVTVKQCGVQILYSMIQMAMGEPVGLSSLKEKWNIGVSQRFLFLEENTRINKIPDADIFRAMKNVDVIEFSKQFLEERVQNPIQFHGARIGYVICSGKNRHSADQFAKSTCKMIVKKLFP